jgi:hypothetical protein
MSQHRRALRIIELESGLEGRLLRPLSAKLLEPTIPEREGMVEREKLLALRGRSRRGQMALAKEYGINDYPCPAGGCRLTDPNFARRMRDLVRYKEDFDLNDVNLLKVGRHFRLSPRAKAVVGRNEEENHRILTLARGGDILFEVKGCGSPITLLRGEASGEEIRLAAAITARYSDARGDSEVPIHYGANYADSNQVILVSPAGEEELVRIRV